MRRSDGFAAAVDGLPPPLGRPLALTVALAHVAAARGRADASLVRALRDPDAAPGALRALAAVLPPVGGELPPVEGERVARIASAIADAAVAEAAARPERIGRFYEELLATDPGHRKGAGSFYTDPRLAEPTVRRVLAPLCPAGSPPETVLAQRVLDPAMGTGSLLLPAWRFLVAAAVAGGLSEPDAQARALRCLHGVDRDPLAVDLCRAALWLEAPPGAPIGDAHLRVGDSLIGAWPGQSLAWAPAALARDAGDQGHDGVHRAAGERTAALVRARRAPHRGVLPPDAWCASWFWPARQAAELPQAPATVASLAERLGFLHWEAAFPAAVEAGGFDAVVGNPPWEALKPSSRAFFARWDPEHPRLGRRAALARRRALFADPSVEDAWLDEREHHRALASWFRRVACARPPGSPFRLQGPGDVNAYKLFTELSLALLRPGGRLGLLLPAAIYTDRGAAPLRGHLLARCSWEWLFSFENRARAFPIDARYKYCVVVAAKGGRTEAVRAAFLRRDPGDWERAEALAEAVPAEQLAPRRGPAVAELGAGDRALLERLRAAGTPCVEGGDGGKAEPAARDAKRAAGEAGRAAGNAERPAGEARRADGEAERGAGEGRRAAGEAIRADGWGLRWATELHTTADAALFPPRGEWEAADYRPTLLGAWVQGTWVDTAAPGALPGIDGRSVHPDDVRGVAFPLWEGRMVGHLSPSAKGWESGRGRSARWRDLPPGGPLLPQFLIAAADAARFAGPRVAYGRVTSSTNTRTVAAAVLTLGATADSVFTLRPAEDALERALCVAGVFGSLVFDAQMRRRLGGLNLSRFVVAGASLPRPEALPPGFSHLVARLALTHPLFAREWLALEATDPTGLLARRPGPLAWAAARADRLRLGAALDALVASAYGLDDRDLLALLADCALPSETRAADLRALPPRGHWRVDRREPPELRATVLAVAALRDLQHEGPDALLEGDGWPLPEALDLRALGFADAPGGQRAVRGLLPGAPADPAGPDDARATLAADAARIDALLRLTGRAGP